MERGTELILQIAGGNAGPVTENIVKEYLPSREPIQLRRTRIKRILGITISDDDVNYILQRLGMTFESNTTGWLVTPPTFRFDIRIEVDLIEELARVYGYQRIPVQLPTAQLHIKTAKESEISTQRIRNLLTDRGYNEVITYSFIASKLQQLLDPSQEAIALLNPLSQDMAVMRTNLWPGLIESLLYNQRRQENRIRLFELGLCFVMKEGELIQHPKIGGIIVGNIYPEQWGSPNRVVDFYDLKNDVEALLELTGHTNFEFKAAEHPALHPQQTAFIYQADQLIGCIGTLRPNLKNELELDQHAYLFELNLVSIQNGLLPNFKPVSKFPAVRRDLAIVVDQSLTAAAIKGKIVSITNDLLKDIQIFDVYQGKGVDLGKKSIALGLTFQHPSRTLVDTEVNKLMETIMAVLSETFHAKLRE